MERDTDATNGQDSMPAGAGTPQGRERARRLLAAGRDRMGPQDWAALQERFGRRPRQIA